MAFWMLQHLAGVLHPPAGSPNIFFRKFVADVYVHLARAMSVFFVPIDLAIGCLALAEGASVAASGTPYASNLFTNDWQMTCARQAVLVGYRLAR